MTDHDSGLRRRARAHPLWITLLAVCVLPVGAAQQVTVRGMLDFEELAMLEDRRAKQHSAARPIFDLVAIWGVEPALSARVRYRGGDVEFRQGRRAALEPHSKRFTLTAIRPPCVLFGFQSAQRKVCMQTETRP